MRHRLRAILTRSSPRRLPRPRAGQTLIELVMSLAILGIILIGAESAVLLASRAIPSSKSLPAQTVSARVALDAMNAELACAISAPEATATSITFKVADRNGDGQPESIRYAWSGTAGAPLTRQYQTDPAKTASQATAVNVVENVSNFKLAYDKRSSPAAQTYSEGTEVLLYVNDPDPSLLSGLLGGGFANLSLSSSLSVAQPFTPTLPTGATGYRVTRAKYKARQNGSNNGSFKVEVLNMSGSTVTTTPVDQVTVAESTLGSSYAWYNVAFTGTQQVTAGNSQAIGIAWVGDTVAADIQYQSAGLLSGVTNMLTGSSVGGVLNGLLGGSGSLCLYVYGVVVTPDPPSTNYYLQNVKETLQVGSDPRASFAAACRTLNDPQTVGP